MWRTSFAMLLVGCSFQASLPGTPDDARIDGAPDALQTGHCVGRFVKVCTADPPPQTVTMPSMINTDTHAGCIPISQGVNVPVICALYAANINVNAETRVLGSRPLLLAATTRIDITSTLDASSKRMGNERGGGANDPSCSRYATAEGGLGGPGGSHGGRGGDGGGGVMSAPKLTTNMRVMGGCPGGSSQANAGGFGGGAIMLVAGTEIVVSGRVLASGAGGNAGNGGGAGGGSGGFIGFDAPTVRVSGSAIANGGGGGGSTGVTSSGEPGEDGTQTTTAAAGGNGGTPTGIDGGDGGADATPDGESGSMGIVGGVQSGSGGGGGAGLILVIANAPAAGGTYSPAYTVRPL